MIRRLLFIVVTVVAALGVQDAGSPTHEAEAFQGLPWIRDVSPRYGPDSGGTYEDGPDGRVTISGGNFTGATAVKFGDTPAEFSFISEAEITAVPPSSVAEGVSVIVIVPWRPMIQPCFVIQKGCANAYFYMAEVDVYFSRSGVLVPDTEIGIGDVTVGVGVEAPDSPLSLTGNLKMSSNAGIPSAFILNLDLDVPQVEATVSISGKAELLDKTFPYFGLSWLGIPGVLDLSLHVEASIAGTFEYQVTLSDFTSHVDARFINGEFSLNSSATCQGSPIGAVGIGACLAGHPSMSGQVSAIVSPGWLQLGPDMLHAAVGALNLGASAGFDSDVPGGLFFELCASILYWEWEVDIPGVRVQQSENVFGPWSLVSTPDHPAVGENCALGSVKGAPPDDGGGGGGGSVDTTNRAIILVQGIASESNCLLPNPPDANKNWSHWWRSEVAGITGVDVSRVWGISYGGGTCSEDPRQAKYTRDDACSGISTALTELTRIVNDPANSALTFDIVGHSLGGFVAAYWASQQSDTLLERVHSVVTLDSPLGTPIPNNEALFDTLDQFFPCNGQHQSYVDLSDEGYHTPIRELSGRKANLVTLDCDQLLCLGGGLAGLVVDTDVDGSWRHKTFEGATHESMPWYEPSKREISAAFATDLVEIGREVAGSASNLGCPAGWSPDSNGDYVKGAACRTIDATTWTIPVEPSEPVGMRLIYGGNLGGSARFDGGDPIPVQPCSRWEYQTQSTVNGRRLCVLEAHDLTEGSSHSVTVSTTEECGVEDCELFVDAIEVIRGSSGGGGSLGGGGLIEREGEVLWINIGPRAHLRGIAPNEIDENVHVTLVGGEYVASGFGVTDSEPADGITRVMADGAEGNDQVILNNIVVPAELTGGGDNDVLVSGSGADVLSGGPGIDVIVANGGADVIDGGAGGDGLDGGPGADNIDGGDGNDQIFGEGDADTLVGGLGNDEMYGGDGPDDMQGNDGADTMFGDGDGDAMSGGADGDAMHGGDDPDTMQGDGGDDVMHGEGGTDSMYGGSGNDEMHGNDGTDYMEGNEDDDTMSGDADGDEMYGGADNDQMNGNDGADRMEGNSGADTMSGDGDADDMFGGTGNDEMHGNDAVDYMEGNSDSDTMTGDDGADRMIGGSSVAGTPDSGDTMHGGAVGDIMLGDNGTIAGGIATLLNLNPIGGNDLMNGNAGDDSMYGGPGDDEMHGNDGSDYMEGNNDSDTMTGDTDPDRMIGGTSIAGIGDGNDNMSGDGADDTMAGDNARIVSAGVQLLDVPFLSQALPSGAFSGDDTMSGGPGTDVMYGQSDNDNMSGNDADDYMEGNAGSDTMTGDAGNDDMAGGSGHDSDGPDGAFRELAGVLDENVVAGDNMSGGDGEDWMAGDNASITRSSPRSIALFDVPFLDGPLPDARAAGNDTMSGDGSPDVMYGQSGDDAMWGGDGDDYMEGNAGSDAMAGDAGEDDMIGGSGHDQGGEGGTFRELRNVLDENGGGTPPGDFIVGGGSADYMLGDNGLLLRPGSTHAYDGSTRRTVELYEVEVSGGPAVDPQASGNDSMSGGEANDAMFGQGGDDSLGGGNGDDYMEGNHGSDVVYGYAGQDDMTGGGSSNTGIITTASGDFDSARQADGLLDGDDSMSGESADSDGATDGDGADAMLGDNGVISRPLDGSSQWRLNFFNGNVNRHISLADVETIANQPLPAEISGDDQMWGNDNDDIMYGQGGQDAMNGGAGHDYMEGNASSDSMWGGPDEDDMIGGSGPTSSSSQLQGLSAGDRISFLPGRTDRSTKTRTILYGTGSTEDLLPTAEVPFGDEMRGGTAADNMIGDNGAIIRPLDGSGLWVAHSYMLQLDSDGYAANRHPTGGAGSRIDRTTEMIEVEYGDTAGSDLMFGDDGDDEMLGQFDDMSLVDPTVGDEMHGGTGEDAMAGDQGIFNDRVLPPGSEKSIAPNGPFIQDHIYSDNILFREFILLQMGSGGDDLMKGDEGGDWMHGGAGRDVMNGDDGNDRMFGDDGDDAMWGGRHHDHLWGGHGYDMLDVHPHVLENAASPDDCTPVDPPDMATWYEIGFDGGISTGNCDGNFEDVDYMYGGWGADAMQANAGDNGPHPGDRLMDWVGVYNLYIVCPGTYGSWISIRGSNPSLTNFLHQLAASDGAYKPGPAGKKLPTPDPSGFNEIGFVYEKDQMFNNDPPYPGTAANHSCTVDSVSVATLSSARRGLAFAMPLDTRQIAS